LGGPCRFRATPDARAAPGAAEQLKLSSKLFADETRAPVLDPGLWAPKARRTAALELVSAQRAGPSGGLTMAGISHVFTISRVAEMLGEDEDLRQEISIDMDPEDGRLTILGPGEQTITAFTNNGLDNLTELVKMVKTNPDLLRRYTPSE
jgi:hypothetical protein